MLAWSYDPPNCSGNTVAQLRRPSIQIKPRVCDCQQTKTQYFPDILINRLATTVQLLISSTNIVPTWYDTAPSSGKTTVLYIFPTCNWSPCNECVQRHGGPHTVLWVWCQRQDSRMSRQQVARAPSLACYLLCRTWHLCRSGTDSGFCCPASSNVASAV